MPLFETLVDQPVVQSHSSDLRTRRDSVYAHPVGQLDEDQYWGLFTLHSVFTCWNLLKVDDSDLGPNQVYTLKPITTLAGEVDAVTGANGGLLPAFGPRPRAKVGVSSSYRLASGGLGNPSTHLLDYDTFETLIDIDSSWGRSGISDPSDVEHDTKRVAPDPDRDLYLYGKVQVEVLMKGTSWVRFPSSDPLGIFVTNVGLYET